MSTYLFFMPINLSCEYLTEFSGAVLSAALRRGCRWFKGSSQPLSWAANRTSDYLLFRAWGIIIMAFRFSEIVETVIPGLLDAVCEEVDFERNCRALLDSMIREVRFTY